MPKIYASLPDKLINKLKVISEENNESFSKMVHKIIEIGLNFYEENKRKSQKTDQDFDLKNREYLIRIMNINAEILRKIYDEPSKLPGNNADSKLLDIKEYAQNLINNKIKNI